MIKQIVFSALLTVFTFSAYAADKFSNANCENDGDGTAATCAASAGGAGAWNDLVQNTGSAGVVAGDTWHICGTFGKAKARISNETGQMLVFYGSGSLGSEIVIDGDCSAYGLLDGVLNGEGSRTDTGGMRYGINIAAFDYIEIKNLTIQNIFGDGVNGIGVGGTVTANQINIVIDNVAISNTRSQCLVMAGENYSIKNSSLSLCGNDAVYIGNGAATAAGGVSYGVIDNLFIDRVSEDGNSSGDGIKIQECTNTTGSLPCSAVIKNNTIYKSGQNKAAINGFGNGNGIIIEDNTVYGYSLTGGYVGVSSSGLGIDGCGSGAVCIIRRNYLSDWDTDGITLFENLATLTGDVYVYSNIIENIDNDACGIDIQGSSTVGIYVFNNSIGRDGNVDCGIGSNSATAASPLVIRNNRISANQFNLTVSNAAQAGGWDSNYNIYDSSQAGVYRQNVTNYTLANWKSTLSFDANSTEYDMSFGSSTPDGFKIGTSNAEYKVGIKYFPQFKLEDYRGCKFSNPPSVGAYEACAGSSR